MCCFLIITELPAPSVETQVTSSAGSGQESCLRLVFSDSANSVYCVAELVRGVVRPPSVVLTRDGAVVRSGSGLSLSQPLPPGAFSPGVVFTCSVCVEVPESGIMDYCNHSSLKISSSGE